jgi:peptide/nickel transport system permease protein
MEEKLKANNRMAAQLGEIWRRYRKSKIALIGLMLLCVFLILILFADFIVPYEKAISQNYDAILSGPSGAYIFGTDNMGRDIFARVVHGTRNSLLIGLSTCLAGVLLGGCLGAVAGYYGGKLDNIIMRVMDIFMSIPPVLLALAIVAALGANMRNLIIAMIVAITPNFTRLVRAVILTVADQDYIEAARSYGCRDSRIIFKYIIPNAMGPIIVNTTMSIASMILTAAGMSFIGMGIKPPSPEWGSMLSEAKNYMRLAPHFAVFPGVTILLAALCFNLIGDGLRDALDPKLKD